MMIGIPCRYVVPCMHNKIIDIKYLYSGETFRKTYMEVVHPLP
jgi:hypothetical protein